MHELPVKSSRKDQRTGITELSKLQIYPLSYIIIKDAMKNIFTKLYLNIIAIILILYKTKKFATTQNEDINLIK